MNTFLKILLCVVAVVVALKFLPFLVGTLLLVGLVAVIATVLLVGGLGAGLVALLATGIALAALLSPLWLPVLAVLGVIALVRRCTTAKA